MAEATASVTHSLLRSQLLERRERLEESRAALPQQEFVRLLHEVDRALNQMSAETYGICEICHTAIEDDRLLANPLACTCLDHMSEPERRALEHDLELAVRVQTGLLPLCGLKVGGWEACYHYEPLGAVSGDFCDLADVRGRMFFLIGDVVGKGVSASLLMAHLHAIFRSLITVDMPITELARRANRIFCEASRPPHYATLVCGFAAPDGEIELVNAGHCLPLLLQGGKATPIASTALPVGLFSEAAYASTHFQLDKDDTLVLYTDGIIECHGDGGEEYGIDRLARILHGYQGEVQKVTEICMADLTTFRNGTAKGDDMTIVALQRTASSVRN